MSEVQNTFFPSVEKRRILMVEDEIINQEILKANLIDSYDIITATTGTEALDILSIQYETISLILLDLNLPDIHGFDVLRKIKSDPGYSALDGAGSSNRTVQQRIFLSLCSPTGYVP